MNLKCLNYFLELIGEMGYSYNKTEALRGTTFKVQLEDNWFSNGDILDLEIGGY